MSGWDEFIFAIGISSKDLIHLLILMLRQDGRVVNRLSVVVPIPKPPTRLCLVEKYARKNSLPVSTWPLPKEFPGNESPKLGVVASFGHLIPQRVIKAFPL